MSKNVSISIKIERELRDEFAAVAMRQHRPASQIIRELMRSFVARSEQPNAESLAAMEELDSGGGFRATTVDEMFRQMGIPCER